MNETMNVEPKCGGAGYLCLSVHDNGVRGVMLRAAVREGRSEAWLKATTFQKLEKSKVGVNV